MNETVVTLVGNVASTVSYGQTSAGVPIANFRLASTERRYDRSRGNWVDGDTNWVTVVAWRWLATNVVSSLSKGDPVVVSGRLRIKEWDEGGKRRLTVEIDARVVGHDLGRGTSAFRWAVQGRPELVAAGSGRSAGKDAAVERTDQRFGGEGPVRGVAAPVGEAVPEWIVEAVRAREAADAAKAAKAAEVAGTTEAVEAGGAEGMEGVEGDGVTTGLGETPARATKLARPGRMARAAASSRPAVPADGRVEEGEESEESEESTVITV